MKEIQVAVTKYECEDGTVCDTKEQAELHEAWCRGDVKTCPSCDGTGSIDPYGDGRVKTKCGTCGGKGHVRRAEVWK